MQFNNRIRILILTLSALAGWILGQVLFPRQELARSRLSEPEAGGQTTPHRQSGQTPDERLAALARLTSSSAQLATVASWTDLQSIDEICAVLDRLERLPDSEAKKFAQVFLLKQWIGLDPDGIFDDPSSGIDRGGLRRLEQIVLLWCEQDPDAAIAALRHHSTSRSVLALALAQIGAEEPAHALRLLEQHHLVAGELYWPVFAALAAEDFHNAAQLAAALQDIEDPQRLANSSEVGRRAAALAAVAVEWALEDGPGALAWLQGLPDADGPAVRTVLQGFIGTWSDKDPQGFLQNLELLSTLDENESYCAAQAAANWWHSDPIKALAWVDSSVADVQLSTQMRAAIANMAAMTDQLPTALEMLGSLPADDDLPSVAAAVAAKAILTDPRGTIEWLATLEDPVDREVAAIRAASELAQRDPAAALEHIDALAAMITRPEGCHFGFQFWDEIIPHLLSQGGEATVDWLEELPPAHKAAALKPLAKNWASSDPRAAADYIVGQADSEYKVKATQEVIRQWARYEPADAARWAAGLAESQNRDFVFKNIASHWAAADPEAASDWIAGLPISSSRDGALVAFASSTTVSDPAGSLQMASSILDSDRRGEALAGTLSSWVRSDRDAAHAALENLSLPKDEIAALRANSSL